MEATPPVRRPLTARTSSRRALDWLGLAAAVGGIGFTILYTVLGALRQGYDPVRQQISALGAGSDGLPLNVGFVLSGLLLIAGMYGLGRSLGRGASPGRRWAVTVLLAAPALGLIICGFFHMDTNLLVHTIGAQIACTLPIITFAVAAGLLWRITRPIALWLAISAALTLLALLGYVFLSATSPSDFSTIEGGGIVGLWERILAIVLFVVCYPSLGLVGVVVSTRQSDR